MGATDGANTLSVVSPAEEVVVQSFTFNGGSPCKAFALTLGSQPSQYRVVVWHLGTSWQGPGWSQCCWLSVLRESGLTVKSSPRTRCGLGNFLQFWAGAAPEDVGGLPGT